MVMDEVIVKEGEKELCKFLLPEIDAQQVLQQCGEGQLKFPADSEKAGYSVGNKSQLVAGIYEWKPRADSGVSLQQFLRRGLPLLRSNQSSRSRAYEMARETHPCRVQHLDNPVGLIREHLARLTADWRQSGYDKPEAKGMKGFGKSEADVGGQFVTHAGGRCNYLLEENGSDIQFGEHPVVTTPDSQEAALADLLQEVQHIGHHAIYPDENPFTTDGTRDVPDGYAAATSGAYRPHLAVQEFKTRQRFLMGDYDAPVDLVRIWRAKVNQDKAALRDLDPFVVHNVVYCLAQLYGYLSRRGNRAGVLSLYHWTWLIVADGQGTLMIAEPVHCTAVGSESTLSVVEVLLGSLAINLQSVNTRFFHAERPGGPLIVLGDLNQRVSRSLNQGRQATSDGAEQQQQVGASQSWATHQHTLALSSLQLPSAFLLLAHSLSPNVHLALHDNSLVALKVARGSVAKAALENEIKILTHLQQLAESCVPLLLGVGVLADLVYMITSFIEGVAFSWANSEHRRQLSCSLKKVPPGSPWRLAPGQYGGEKRWHCLPPGFWCE